MGNVVLIIADTLRRDHLSCYDRSRATGFGSRTSTPNFQRLADRGTVFDNAYLGSFPCMPARRDMYTGNYEFPWRGWGPLEEDDVDVVSVASANDRFSMLITDHFHLFEAGAGNYHFGFDAWDFIRGQEADRWITDPSIDLRWPCDPARNHHTHHRHLRNVATFRHSEEDHFAPLVFRRAADWVERNRSRDPFFLMIDCFDPHEPWDPPRHYVDSFDPGYEGEEIIGPIYRRLEGYVTESEYRHVQALYAGEVEMTDRWLGYFLDRLEQLRLMEDTTIILVTDHGTFLGDHGWAGKLHSQMWDSVSHIPLLVSSPEAQGGQRRSQLVQPVDLFPTVLEGLGVQDGPAVHGSSLLPLMRDGSVRGREVACFGQFGKALNVTDGEWVLYRWPPDDDAPLYWYGRHGSRFHGVKAKLGPYEKDRQRFAASSSSDCESALFHLADDPLQQHDLLAQRPDVEARLVQGLGEFLAGLGAPGELAHRFELEPGRSESPAGVAG